MSLKDLELEDGLKDVGEMLTSPPSDLQQLLLLLDKAENFLSRVEQSPSASMSVALQPVLKALVGKDLLGHSDVDVKVAIAYCLSEITRITAPNAPYDDDLMKEIFGLIVGAFKNLDELSSRSFPKRVSILETVAKVRSCVLMLDLDCDDLILEMFHLFLKTIRSKHSDTVFSSMETVMTLVIEETESISGRLLSCLLDCVKNAEKDNLPMAKKLAEKVLVNCSLMLKPYLTELFNDSGALLSDYSKIVAAVLQGNFDTSMQNEMNASGDNQESEQREGEVLHPENAVVAVDRSLKSVMSNGTFQIGNEDSMASKQKNEHHHHSGQPRGTNGTRLCDSDILDSGTAKLNSRSDLISRIGGRKALLKLSISNEDFRIGNNKEVPAIGRRKDSSKETDFSQADGPCPSKEVESTVPSKTEKNELELTSSLPDVVASVHLHSPNEHDASHHVRGSRHTRGQPSQSKSSGKRNDVGSGSSITGRKEFLFSSQATSGELPTRELNLKDSEVLSDSKRKRITGSAKKSRSSRAKDSIGSAKDCKSSPITATCDSDTKLLSHSDSDTKLLSHRGRNGSRRKVREVNFSEKKRSAGIKQQQKGVKHAEAEDNELKLKELFSSPKSTVKELIKDQSHVMDTTKTRSSRKRARGAQEELLSSPKSSVKELIKDQSHVKDTTKTRSRRKHAPGAQEELLSSPKSTVKELIKDQSHVKDTTKTRSRRKHARGAQEAFGRMKRRKGLNDALVGSKIKVWWPDDKMFYDGIVDSFDRSTKMHKILYNDGDVEVLLLNKEQWEFIEGETKMDGEKDTPDISASEISPDSTAKGGPLPKHRRKPRVKIQSQEAKNSIMTRGKSGETHPEERHKDNNQTNETANNLENDTSQRIKVEKDAPKRRGKSKGDSSRYSRKSKNNFHISVKKSGTPKPKSAEGRRKPGRRLGEKAKGGMTTPRIRSNLKNAQSMSKLGKADASTSGKKRKRVRLGK